MTVSTIKYGKVEILLSLLNSFLIYINFYGSELFCNKFFAILEKKGFSSSLELFIAHSIPGGSQYVLHIFHPLGHEAHCLTCQKLS